MTTLDSPLPRPFPDFDGIYDDYDIIQVQKYRLQA